MIGAKSQLKWFWRSVAPVVVLFVTLKVKSASARFVTDPQTTPKPCVRLQRKAVWKRARKIAIMVYGSNCLFGSRFPRRAQPSHAGDALEPVRLLGSHPCRGTDGNLRTIRGGQTFRPPEPAECKIWLLSAVFMPGKTAANRRRPGGPSMARRPVAKNRLADRPRVCAGPSFVQRCANSMIRHRRSKTPFEDIRRSGLNGVMRGPTGVLGRRTPLTEA